MKLFKKKTHWQRMMKQISQVDFLLIKLTLFFLGLGVASAFPMLTTYDPYYYLVLTALFAFKPILVWLRTA